MERLASRQRYLRLLESLFGDIRHENTFVCGGDTDYESKDQSCDEELVHAVGTEERIRENHRMRVER